ncbi:17067_t:CDS:2, partial [Rhizophagus irregularis]
MKKREQGVTCVTCEYWIVPTQEGHYSEFDKLSKGESPEEEG